MPVEATSQMGSGEVLGGGVTDLGERDLGVSGRHAFDVRLTRAPLQREHGTDRGVGRLRSIRRLRAGPGQFGDFGGHRVDDRDGVWGGW